MQNSWARNTKILHHLQERHYTYLKMNKFYKNLYHTAAQGLSATHYSSKYRQDTEWKSTHKFRPRPDVCRQLLRTKWRRIHTLDFHCPAARDIISSTNTCRLGSVCRASFFLSFFLSFQSVPPIDVNSSLAMRPARVHQPFRVMTALQMSMGPCGLWLFTSQFYVSVQVAHKADIT